MPTVREWSRRSLSLVLLLFVGACSNGESPREEPPSSKELLSSRELLASLVKDLGCDFTDSGEYEGVRGEAFKGPDCWTEAGQYRIHVYDSAAERTAHRGSLAIVTGDRIGTADDGSRTWHAVVGDRFIIRASSLRAAQIAQKRIGGAVEPATTPVSYYFPSDIPKDARERAVGGG